MVTKRRKHIKLSANKFTGHNRSLSMRQVLRCWDVPTSDLGLLRRGRWQLLVLHFGLCHVVVPRIKVLLLHNKIKDVKKLRVRGFKPNLCKHLPPSEVFSWESLSHQAWPRVQDTWPSIWPLLLSLGWLLCLPFPVKRAQSTWIETHFAAYPRALVNLKHCKSLRFVNYRTRSHRNLHSAWYAKPTEAMRGSNSWMH